MPTANCVLVERDVLDFLIATQPKEWKKLEQHHGAAVKQRFLKRLAAEIAKRGALDVLRNGIKDSGCKFDSRTSARRAGSTRTRRLHAANLFAVVRQLRYSTKNENSLDLVLFLNGIPIFTAELKNPLNGQDVEDARKPVQNDRDPREPLLAYGRCLAHFAVDPDLVYVTTQLAGPETRFLPFNQGKFGGAGNPPVPPTRSGYATAYLWEETWARDSVLDLVRQFIHEVEEEDDRGRKTGNKLLIFPALPAARCRAPARGGRARDGRRPALPDPALGRERQELHHRLARAPALDAARRRTTGASSTRSSSSPTGACSTASSRRTMRQFEQTLGVVENIDTTSRQLKEALESGKTIIVTTLQKFPVIAKEIGELPGKRFAVIVDEAHSSQSGESTKSLKAVLAAGRSRRPRRGGRSRDAGGGARRARSLAEMEKRGRLPNLSLFAFTATPKPKTLELFGTKRPTGSSRPSTSTACARRSRRASSSTCSQNYTTYKAYWRLLKKVEDDPRYDKKKAATCSSRSSSCTRTRSARKCGSASSTSPPRCRARSAGRPRR